jgi:glycosyltransferase involved in cell wall biosynthesis
MDPDTVMFLHGLDAPSMALMRALRSAESCPRLVFLLDDLLATADPRVNAALVEAVQLCDQLVCTTQALAEWVRAELRLPAETVAVVENALPIDAWSKLARAPGAGSAPIRVLWAGASQHQADLDLLLPVVEATKTRYRWVFMGLCPRGVAGDPRIEFHSGVEFDAYPSALAALRPDIAVAPLVDTPFNRCKSALKLMEYGALGLPVIATAITPYASAPILRAANQDQWLAALRELEDPLRRQTLGLALKSWVSQQHSLSAESTLRQWRTALRLSAAVGRTVVG